MARLFTHTNKISLNIQNSIVTLKTLHLWVISWKNHWNLNEKSIRQSDLYFVLEGWFTVHEKNSANTRVTDLTGVIDHFGRQRKRSKNLFSNFCVQNQKKNSSKICRLLQEGELLPVLFCFLVYIHLISISPDNKQ